KMSRRNVVNRGKQTMPACSGRRSVAVVRHNISLEKGVPISSIGRAETYMSLHTRKDKAPQNKDVEMGNECIGKEYYLLGGWPLRHVAKGVLLDVNPDSELGDRKLGEGNTKVYVSVVNESSAELPYPHDRWIATLGQLGQGYVIWRSYLVVASALEVLLFPLPSDIKGMKVFVAQIDVGQKGKDGEPSVGPVYRNLLSKDDFPALDVNMPTTRGIIK
ncbi:hypothetical protein FRX31_019533, partial [Thalictrum thalictroides]